MLAALLFVGAIDPGSTGTPSCDPYRATSPSGRHFVEVVPSTRDGSGPCRVLIGEAQHFYADESLPRTLRDAVVDDAGDIAGWCSRNRWDTERPTLFLRAHGGTFRECALPAEAQLESCSGAGLVLQPEHARALLRVTRRGNRTQREEWWPIAMASGEWGTRILPERPPHVAGANWPFQSLGPIGVHDALLAHEAGQFTLYDAQGHVLWEHFEWCNVCYLCGGPKSEFAMGPFIGGFTLRMPCEWQEPDAVDDAMEQRYYCTNGDCTDLCVEEVGRRASPDEPSEPAPAYRVVQLERAGAPQSMAPEERSQHLRRPPSRSNAEPIATLPDGNHLWSDGLGTHAWTTLGDDPDGTALVQFAQRLDGKWLGWIREALPLEDGAIAILDNACLWRGEDQARLVLFTERGEAREQFTLPADLVWGLVARGDWLCVHAWYKCSALLVRRSTREVFEFPLGPGGADRELLLPARVDELWVLDPKSRGVERFRLPGT